MKKNYKPNGFTLIESLVACAILSIVVLAAAGAVSQAYRNLNQQYFLLGRDRLALAITQAAGSPSAIRDSLIQITGTILQDPDNQAMFSCIHWGSPPCDGSNTFRPFRLYDPYYLATQGSIQQGGPMAGTPTKPIQYNPDGSSCDTRSNSCPAALYPISVYSEFRSICPPIWDGFYDGTNRDYMTGQVPKQLWDATIRQPTFPESNAGMPFPGPLGIDNTNPSAPYWPGENLGPSAVFPGALSQPANCLVTSDMVIRLTFSSLKPTTGMYAGFDFPTFTTTAIVSSPASSTNSGLGLTY